MYYSIPYSFQKLFKIVLRIKIILMRLSVSKMWKGF